MYTPDPRSRMISDKTPFIQTFRDYYRTHGCFVEVASQTYPEPDQLRMELKYPAGRGWMEFIQMSQGLGVGMCEYELSRPLGGGYPEEMRPSFRINLMLSGEFELFVPAANRNQVIRGGEIWACRNLSEHLHFKQPPGKPIRGISIDLPKSMIESWLSAPQCETNRCLRMLLGEESLPRGTFPPGMFPLSRSPQRTAALTELASQILDVRRDTVCGRLHFEALTLELLARILDFELPDSARSPRAPIDETIDILRTEWANPPTISALSRRVGLNECYLKAGFRQRTGRSIGEYVRQLRMEHALELLESGRSVLQTATAVGYSNPSHFSAAFKKQYGRLPSSCLAR